MKPKEREMLESGACYNCPEFDGFNGCCNSKNPCNKEKVKK
jgi:hypothetical protein